MKKEYDLKTLKKRKGKSKVSADVAKTPIIFVLMQLCCQSFAPKQIAYRYKNPALNFIPISVITEKLKLHIKK